MAADGKARLVVRIGGGTGVAVLTILAALLVTASPGFGYSTGPAGHVRHSRRRSRHKCKAGRHRKCHKRRCKKKRHRRAKCRKHRSPISKPREAPPIEGQGSLALAQPAPSQPAPAPSQPTPSEPELEPAPKLDAVSPDQVEQLPTEGDPTLVVAGEHAYSPGQFLAAAPGSGAPGGFLLKVVGATASGGQTEVQTEPGSLYEAVPNGELNSDLGDLSSAHALNADARRLTRVIAASDSGEPNSVPFDQRVTCTDSAEMTLTGSLTTAVGPHLSIKWHKFIGIPVGIDKAKATLDATVEAEAEGSVSGEDTCELEPITLFDPEWETIVDVAGVPVPVTVSIPIELSGSAGVSGSIAVKASAEAHGSLGVAYEHGELSGIHEISSEAEVPEPAIEAEATLQASIGPDATITAGWEVKHLGGVAATLGVGVFTGAKLSYQPFAEPPGSLCAPFEVTGSVALDLPFDTIEKSGNLYEGNIKCVHWGGKGLSPGWSGVVQYNAVKHESDHNNTGGSGHQLETFESTFNLNGTTNDATDTSTQSLRDQPFEWRSSHTREVESIQAGEGCTGNFTLTEEGSGEGATGSEPSLGIYLERPEEGEPWHAGLADAGWNLTFPAHYEWAEHSTCGEDQEGEGSEEALVQISDPIPWFFPGEGEEEGEKEGTWNEFQPSGDGLTIAEQNNWTWHRETEEEEEKWGETFVYAVAELVDASLTVHLTRLPDQDHDGTPDSTDDCPTVFDYPQEPAACGP